MVEAFALTAPEAPMRGGAEFSDCGRYRFRLWRRWDDRGVGRAVCWIMLNPSKAGAHPDDNDTTVSKCIGFARRWNYQAIHVVNLYQLIETDSRQLFSGRVDASGAEWFERIEWAVKLSLLVVCAWGSQGPVVDGRASEVVHRLTARGHALHCLGRTKGGAPRHPSRLGYDAELKPYGGDA